MSGVTAPELLLIGLFLLLLGCGLALLLWRPGARAEVSAAALLQDWDRRVANMPQHGDLRLLVERLATVERVCDVTRAEVGGVKDAMARVERTTNLLLAQQLDGRDNRGSV